MMGKEVVVAKFKNLFGHFMVILRKTTTRRSHCSLFPGWNSNQWPPEIQANSPLTSPIEAKNHTTSINLAGAQNKW
jgi:hypothetical protein